ncbi:YsnF/AvaK domain-containing protein [Priestia megaterium]
MRMNKRVVGTFFSEKEALDVINNLKRQGYRETDIMVISNSKINTFQIGHDTNVIIEAGSPAVSSLAGVMMDNFFTMMTGGMGLKQGNGLKSKLIRMGIPDFSAVQCETDVAAGKILILIDAVSSEQTPAYGTYTEHNEHRAVQLREEKLDVLKERVQVGEVKLHKKVIEEERTVHVPVTREEFYIERRPVVDGDYNAGPLTEDEIIRVPIMEERVEITKRPVIVEEVIIGKKLIQETKEWTETIKKEEASVEPDGLASPEVYENMMNYTDHTYAQVSAALASDVEAEYENSQTTNNEKPNTQANETSSSAKNVKNTKSVATAPADTKKREGRLKQNETNAQKEEAESKTTNKSASNKKN